LPLRRLKVIIISLRRQIYSVLENSTIFEKLFKLKKPIEINLSAIVNTEQ